MIKSFAEILKEILEDVIKEEKEQAEKNKSEKCVEMLDRNITLGIRERICNENSCGFTHCPLFVLGACIANHHCRGIKVKIPVRILNAETEDGEQHPRFE